MNVSLVIFTDLPISLDRLYFIGLKTRVSYSFKKYFLSTHQLQDKVLKLTTLHVSSDMPQKIHLCIDAADIPGIGLKRSRSKIMQCRGRADSFCPGIIRKGKLGIDR